MMVLLVEVVIFAISLIIAKRMVKNRSFLAKGMVIGKDDDETKEVLFDIAQMASRREIHIPMADDECKITITGKKSEITEVKVENGKTIITKTFGKGSLTSSTVNKGFSELSATVLVAIGLWAYISFFLIAFGLLTWALFEIY